VSPSRDHPRSTWEAKRATPTTAPPAAAVDWCGQLRTADQAEVDADRVTTDCG